MYTLDFETIKQVMQEHQKTGLLSAEVPAGLAGLREPCRVEINILAGNIVSCAIVGDSGSFITGNEATQELARLGRIRWTFTPQQRANTQPVPAIAKPMPAVTKPVKVSQFPRRTLQVEQWQIQSWPRLHRTVFALADGTKPVTKIAEMLSTPPDLIERALRDLQSIGAIILESRNGRGPDAMM